MNDLSDDTLQKIRNIVSDEVSGIRSDVAVLKTDIVDLKADVGSIKLVLGNHSIMLAEMRFDVRKLKNGFRGQSRDIHKLSVLFEDLDDRFQAASEAS